MALAVFDGENRRSKTLIFLSCCAFAALVPYLLDPSKSFFPAVALAILLGTYGLRIVLRNVDEPWAQLSDSLPNKDEFSDLPNVDVLISVRDEENVVERLVKRLSAIKYPSEKINICIIDDGSQDKTSSLLDQAIDEYSNLKVLTRSRSSGGGKSGALNFALKNLKAEWVFILDADAQFQEDILLRIVPFANKAGFSAIQLRKVVCNSKKNLLTCCQAMEMAMDAVIQQGRLFAGGVAELRGNGQLLKRAAIENCGGFNEATVTDDLDLSFRLLLSESSVGIVWNPPVEEEAVETLKDLWRQRKRWAEGGLQRFFDYWPYLVSKKLKFKQRLDLASFFLLQYALPVVSFTDIFLALVNNSLPRYLPLTFTAFSVSAIAYFRGCIRQVEGPPIPSPNFLRLAIAIVYLSHWFFVIPWVTIRMAFLPKKFIWVKTSHKGD